MNDQHPHFCDCDLCLNGSGGLVLPGCGVVHPAEPEPSAIPRRRSRGLDVPMPYMPGSTAVTEAGWRVEVKYRQELRDIHRRAAERKRERERTAA